VDFKGGKQLYIPINLEPNYKKNGIKIRFSRILLEEKTQLYKPGPTDIPEV